MQEWNYKYDFHFRRIYKTEFASQSAGKFC